MLTKIMRVEPAQMGAIAAPKLYSLQQAGGSTRTSWVRPTRLTRVTFRGFVYCVILLFEASNNKSV
jgi:hypothetical protein